MTDQARRISPIYGRRVPAPTKKQRAANPVIRRDDEPKHSHKECTQPTMTAAEFLTLRANGF